MSLGERKTELLRVLDETDHETRTLLSGLTDEDLSKKTAESNWTVGQLAGHIAQVEQVAHGAAGLEPITVALHAA